MKKYMNIWAVAIVAWLIGWPSFAYMTTSVVADYGVAALVVWIVAVGLIGAIGGGYFATKLVHKAFRR